jgi:serine/threonine protein kinase
MKADVFSLGILLYFMFTGGVPVEDTRAFHPSLVDYRRVPPDVAELIAAALQLSPTHRPTVSQLRANAVFDELFRRAPSAHAAAFPSEIQDGVLRKVADRLDIAPDDVRDRLSAEGPNKEKILSFLIERAPAADGRKTRHSLPADDAIHVCAPEETGRRVTASFSASSTDVMNAIVRHALDRRFCVSAGDPGVRKTLLNRQENDISVQLTVTAAEHGSVVCVDGDPEAVELIQKFLDTINS